jgi:hypothetical protein
MTGWFTPKREAVTSATRANARVRSPPKGLRFPRHALRSHGRSLCSVSDATSGAQGTPHAISPGLTLGAGRV